jgi:NADPH:quinone reductase-like Zn-dependent oxidoreductase
MQAAVLHAFGTSPRCEEFPDPIAGDDEVVLRVSAAALKPVDRQMASGSHYASAHQLPVICGTDGVGRLQDGQRVFFGGGRPPYGAMAQRTVVRKAFTFPIPDSLSDETAAAIPNPGVSAWLSLAFRAKLMAGENVLIIGATGVTGRMAVKIAKLLGAARVVAAGRNPRGLAALREQGADDIISLEGSAEQLSASFAQAAGITGFQVVIDYVWGKPAEAFLAAVTRKEFAAIETETRYVQVGESAGPSISLLASVLRSTPLTMMGTAGMPPGNVLVDALQKVMSYAASGELRIETETVPLADVEAVWNREQSGKRMVLIP